MRTLILILLSGCNLDNLSDACASRGWCDITEPAPVPVCTDVYSDCAELCCPTDEPCVVRRLDGVDFEHECETEEDCAFLVLEAYQGCVYTAAHPADTADTGVEVL